MRSRTRVCLHLLGGVLRGRSASAAPRRTGCVDVARALAAIHGAVTAGTETSRVLFRPGASLEWL
jgi:hypothetical protein